MEKLKKIAPITLGLTTVAMPLGAMLPEALWLRALIFVIALIIWMISARIFIQDLAQSIERGLSLGQSYALVLIFFCIVMAITAVCLPHLVTLKWGGFWLIVWAGTSTAIFIGLSIIFLIIDWMVRKIKNS